MTEMRVTETSQGSATIVSPRETPLRIGIFGHYGNRNLGDESIIEAVIANLRKRLPEAELVCLSIDPTDSRDRHQLEAFPIRYRPDYPEAEPSGTAPHSRPADTHSSAAVSAGWKARLKSMPVTGPLIRVIARARDTAAAIARERCFLRQVRARVSSLDLLLITGSNQFLDNFGGPWGFPYTLLKWTLLAKRTGARVAYISVGAGPLTHPLSFFMLRQALRRADFVSFRDQGSLELIRRHTGVDGPVFPDLAHSLVARYPYTSSVTDRSHLRVAVNPMPVYDARYWYQADDGKYRTYVSHLTSLCREILRDGHELALFSTQQKDENVMADVLARLQQDPEFSGWSARILEQRNRSVQELMANLAQTDLVVATRFHATVLPLQLGIPVLGICYYRKAQELLEDVGLGDFQVPLDALDPDVLIGKYRTLSRHVRNGDIELSQAMARYREALDEQYGIIARLATQENRASQWS